MAACPKKVVLAYPADWTPASFSRDPRTYGCEVVAYAAELGQGDELKAIRRRPQERGQRVHRSRSASEFVNDFVCRWSRAGPS